MSAGNVTPIRDAHGEVLELTQTLYSLVGGIPADDLEPGYRLMPESVFDLRRASELLTEALSILERVADREDPIYSAYCHHLEEA